MLTRLTYYSEITSAFDAGLMQCIVQKSQENNRRRDVSGCLVQQGKYFVQLIEGPRTTLTSLFLTIAEDLRHKNPVLVEMRDISARRFSQWSMMDLSAHFLPAIQGILFDPDAFTGSALGHSLEKAARHIEGLQPRS